LPESLSDFQKSAYPYLCPLHNCIVVDVHKYLNFV
jgi:hypothetical protein